MPTPTDPTWMRPLGSTGLRVSAICLGGAPLSSMPENFGYDVAEQQAVDLVRSVLDSPIRFIDTANGYSAGESERRIGAGVRAFSGLPHDVVVATKVDAAGRDYSGPRVRESVAESRERLGLDDLPLVHLHDPEFHDWAEMTAPGGTVDTLVDMKRTGAIGSIGLAGGHAPTMNRYLDLGVFDVLLVHNRWTLVDRGAETLIDQAAHAGVAVVNAAIYGGSILARDHDDGNKSYGYRPAPPDLLEAITAMRRVCERFGTDLATAALQFSLMDDRIASTIVGISKPERVTRVLLSAAHSLPADFWDEIDSLVPPASGWLDSERTIEVKSPA